MHESATTDDRFESVLGNGAMLNWITIADPDMALYEDWYNYQHLPERVSTPGFLRGRRFRATSARDTGHVDFLTVYETVDAAVLASPEYLRRLDNPTELTRRVVPLFEDFRRAACTVTAVRGDGSAGRVVVLEVDAPAGAEALRAALGDTVFPGLIAEHRLHSGSLYEPDVEVSAAKNSTMEGRDSPQQSQAESLTILAELQTGVSAADLAADVLARSRMAGAPVASPLPAREFELLFELRSH